MDEAYLMTCAMVAEKALEALKGKHVPTSTIVRLFNYIPTGRSAEEIAVNWFGTFANMLDYLSSNYLRGSLVVGKNGAIGYTVWYRINLNELEAT